MSCDKLVFDLSQEVEGSPNVFVKKDWLNILDNQNGQYNSNQSVIDTSQLTNSNRFMSYRESYLAVPLLLSVGTTTLATAANFLPATAGSSADYCVGLKNWFGQIVHSLTLDYNGTTIIQQTPYCNMWNSFRLMTSMSWDDVWTTGASIGFYPDDPLSFSFEAVAGSLSGQGTCNTSNLEIASSVVSGAFNNYKAGQGNIGFLRRQQYINYDPAGDSGSGTYNDLLTNTACTNIWKSFISSKVNGVNATSQGSFQISIQAVIYLKHLHSFFNNVPLIKGAYMKATLNLNNTSVAFTATATTGVLTIQSVSNAVGGVCPLMIASGAANNGGRGLNQGAITNTTTTSYIANISVGATCLDPTLATFVAKGALSTNIYLYVPAYTFNPVFESAYLSSPIKQIKYTDIYQYQIVNVLAGGTINNLVTNGIANIKSVLLIAFYSPGSGNVNTGLPTGLPVFQSPFDTAGCCSQSPMVQFNNFNIVVSGQNIIYNTQQRSYEQFQDQFYGVNAVNGGMTDGITSGLIDRLGFDMINGFYYVDVSRMLPVEESVPKSIQIIGTNQSAKAIDLYVFVEYGVDISIDALTGVRV